MAFSSPQAWHDANYRYLIAALNQLQIEFLPLSSTDQPILPAISIDDLSNEDRAGLNLEQLCRIFQLSPFDRQLLLLCVGFSLWPAFARACIQASGNEEKHLNLAMAQQLLRTTADAVLNPYSPLFTWKLFGHVKSRTLLMQALHIDKAVLHYLLGYAMQDKQLSTLLVHLPSKQVSALTACYAEQIQQVKKFWQQSPAALSVLHLCGEEDIHSLRYILQESCANLCFPLYYLDVNAIPADQTAWQDQLNRLVRETRLHENRVYVLECDGAIPEKQRAMQQLVQVLPNHCVMLGKTPLPVMSYPVTTINVPLPNADQQYRLWEDTLSNKHHPGEAALREITTQFSLSASQILQIAEAFQCQLVDQMASPDTAKTLWRFCHEHLRRDTHELIHVLQPCASWEDISLPESQLQLLKNIVAQVRQRHTVYQQWGFAQKNGRGLGISALFAGPSGTGKTLAAEVIARELQLDIYHIDLGSVVSKYIGETEKNLKAVFAHAEASGAVLLFDEADALFGKRMEVKDSHDHYANMQVNYLLQCIESYRGLSILTTNLKNALDDAFLRRIRFIVSFPFPDPPQRSQIWQKVFPSQTPLADLDWDKLARLKLAGGHIRNIALNGAFLAASQQQPVSMAHLLQATQGEYLKLERVLTESEVRDWVQDPKTL